MAQAVARFKESIHPSTDDVRAGLVFYCIGWTDERRDSSFGFSFSEKKTGFLEVNGDTRYHMAHANLQVGGGRWVEEAWRGRRIFVEDFK